MGRVKVQHAVYSANNKGVVNPVASAIETTSIYADRITVKGKFLYQGESKYWIKGVTYGTFRPRDDACFGHGVIA